MRAFALSPLLAVAIGACAPAPHAQGTAPARLGEAPMPPPCPTARGRRTHGRRTHGRLRYRGAGDRPAARLDAPGLAHPRARARRPALDAFTRWRIAWRYQVRRQGDVCRFVSVDVDVTTTLWRWTPPPDAGLVADWADRARVLRAHEDGRVHYALWGARDVYRALRPMRAPTCDALHDLDDGEGQRLLERV